MFDTIPPTPAAVVDVPLDPTAALGLAAQALTVDRPLATTFKTSKVVGEMTGQQANGLSYRTFVRTPLARFRMNDGYITATQTGPNATRLQIHESKRYVMLMGLCTAIGIALIVIAYFAFAPSRSRYGFDAWQRRNDFDWSIFLWVGVVAGLASAGGQIYEMLGMPAKLANQIRQGFVGGPALQPHFGGQHGVGAEPQGGFAAAPQGGVAAPPQGGFAPPPQQPQGFGAQQGFPAQPQPTPAYMAPPGFPQAPQQAGSFRPPPSFPAQPQPFGLAQDAAPPPPAVASGSPLSDSAVLAQLEELGKLRDGGIITDADYDQARAAILAKQG